MKGTQTNIRNPQDAIKLGIGYLPEDRQKQGLVLDWDIGQNITLSNIEHYANGGWLSEARETEVSKSLAEKVSVKAQSIYDLVSSLSGGNQQKVVFAKLLTAELDVLILDEPTKGVDVGAKFAIYEIMNDLAAQGYGIILISSDMPEVIGMSDRIIVMREGRITGRLDRTQVTQEAILEASMSDQLSIRVSCLLQ